MGLDNDDQHSNPESSFWSSSPSSDLNGKILLVAIVSLSVVTVFVVALHLYARFVLRRRARRRASFIRILRLNTTSQPLPPKTGLDPGVIASLPTFLVATRNRDRPDTATSVDCAVCLSDMEEQDTARLLPNCNHSFHVECIDTWLASNSTCPICRTPAEPTRVMEPEPREAPASLRGEGGPSAPPLEGLRLEGSASWSEPLHLGGFGKTSVSGASWRMNSFRRMLSRERCASWRINPSCAAGGTGHGVDDLERQNTLIR